MINEKIIQLAVQEGFAAAAIVDTRDIVFDPSFRPYCEENLCGQYGVNYACQPDCGSPEEMKQRVLAHKKALVLQTIWEISDYSDKATIKNAKNAHNTAEIQLVKKLRNEGHDGLIVGASGCAFCSPCAITRGNPAASRNTSFPVCPPTVSLSKNWQTNVAWNTTVARDCWRSSECMFLIN